MSVDAALAERFKRDWYRLTKSACGDKALVALSGGPDSTALLLLFKAISPSLSPPVAATVDHQLRASSSTEAEAAADLCRSIGMPHTILVGDLPPRVGPTANLSARARALRYSLLKDHAKEVGARWIVTAHHAEDQLETLVMRLNRGSGVRGLSGVRAVQDKVVRPLLSWRRGELAAIVASAGITPVADPSNIDERFDRARLRKLLDQAEWLDPVAASRSAGALADAEEAIEWAADTIEPDVVQFGQDQAILKPLFLPVEIKRRLVERCLRQVDPNIEPRGRALSDLVATLERLDDATLGGVMASARFVTHGEVPNIAWVFRPAPPRTPPRSPSRASES